jgi:hypothetical protein
MSEQATPQLDLSQAVEMDRGDGPSLAPPDPTKVDDMFGAALDQAIKNDIGQTPEDPRMPRDPEEQAKAAAAEKPKAEDKTAEKAEDKPKLDLTPDHSDDALDKIESPSAKDWKLLKTTKKELQQQLKAAQAEAEQLKTKTADIERVQELQAKVNEYEAQLKEASVLSDPALTRDIDRRLKVVHETVAASLDDAKAQEFSAIMALPPGKHRDKVVGEFMEDIPAWQQGKMGTLLARADELNAERNAILGEAKANIDAVISQRKEMQVKQQEQVRARQNLTFETVANEFKQLPGWKEIFGDPEQAKPFLDAAKNVFHGNVGSEKDLARKTILAETAPALLEHAIDVSKQLVDKDQKIAGLEAELKKYKDATGIPNTLGGAAPGGGDEDFVSGAVKAWTQDRAF